MIAWETPSRPELEVEFLKQKPWFAALPDSLVTAEAPQISGLAFAAYSFAIEHRLRSQWVTIANAKTLANPVNRERE